MVLLHGQKMSRRRMEDVEEDRRLRRASVLAGPSISSADMTQCRYDGS
jgi:hypothetical protein